MEETKRIRSIHQDKLEHVPELLHRIQVLLPPKEAARTCVLSKSWLHAWSTIPNLRFERKEEGINHLKVVEGTLLRYIRHDIPFEKIDLPIDIENHELASFAEKLIRLIATKSCLKELCLSMRCGSIDSFTMPDEIFSSNKLYKMSISGWEMIGSKPMETFLFINRNPVINCVALRVLELSRVSISEEVLEKLLSTCILLEKIHLFSCEGLKNIKVRNLRYLRELGIHSDTQDQILDIYNVPNIRSFNHSSKFQRNPLTLNIDSLRCVTKLILHGLVMDDSFLDMLKSKFHSLESLILEMESTNSNCLDITCLPLKRLYIRHGSFTEIKVNAPKLHGFFYYDGSAMPSLVFPAIAPAQITLSLDINKIDDKLFFVNIAEALKLSSRFDIRIMTERFDLEEPLEIDMDDLKTRFTIPSTNVQRLAFQTSFDKGLWEPEHSSFFDAFFVICHPKHVVAYPDQHYRVRNRNYFCKLMLKEVMRKSTRNGFWPDYLKEVKIKINDGNGGQWETLTDAWKSCHDESSLFSYTAEFKLNWL